MMQSCNSLLQITPLFRCRCRIAKIYTKKGLNDRKSRKPSRHLSRNNFSLHRYIKKRRGVYEACVCVLETHTRWPLLHDVFSSSPPSFLLYRQWLFLFKVEGAGSDPATRILSKIPPPPPPPPDGSLPSASPAASTHDTAILSPRSIQVLTQKLLFSPFQMEKKNK